MGNFNRGGGRDGGGRGGFNGRGRDFGRPSFQQNKSWGSDRPQMHSAVCADCGNSCEVPFMPKNGKPVYCKDCFSKMGGGGREDRGERKSFSNDRPAFKPNFENGRPSFDAGKGDGEVKKRLDAIEQKLDRLVRSVDLLLGSKLPKENSQTKPVSIPEVKKVIEKSAAFVKEEMKAVVKKVVKDIKDEKASKSAKKAPAAKLAKKGKK